MLYINWYKNGRPLKLNETTWIDGIEYKKGGHVLKISRNDTRGSGRYTCYAWNMAGHARGSSYLVIIYGELLMFLNQ